MQHPSPHTPTEVSQNLQDIKQALEKILEATSPNQVARAVSQEESTDKQKIADIAKLHCFASEAYSNLMDILIKRG